MGLFELLRVLFAWPTYSLGSVYFTDILLLLQLCVSAQCLVAGHKAFLDVMHHPTNINIKASETELRTLKGSNTKYVFIFLFVFGFV